MIPQDRIKNHLANFLLTEGPRELMDNCVLIDGAQWLNAPIKITINQSAKNKILIQIENNSQQGFTEFKQEYTL